MKICEQICKLSSLVQHEINEEVISLKGEKWIGALRALWTTNKSEFTQTDVETLKKVATQLNAIHDFIEEIELFAYIQDKEDIDEHIGHLYGVVKHIQGLAVAGRVLKEIRELREKKMRLPCRQEKVGALKKKQAIHSLNVIAPRCMRCASQMVIRQGYTTYFWGCSNFPTCWETRCLSKDQKKTLQETPSLLDTGGLTDCAQNPIQ